MRRCRSRDCFLNPPFSKPIQSLENRIHCVNRKMAIPMNFLILTRRTLITWGRFAIPEKLPFREEEIAVIGKRVRREPLPGVDFRVPMRDGSRRERGEDSIRSGDLISTLFPPICFLHGRYYSRFHRGRSVFPPDPGACSIQ